MVYDVASGALVGEHHNPDGAYRYAAFVPGTHTLFAGGDQGAYLLDAENGGQLQVFSAPESGLFGENSAFVTVSPDGRYGALHVWTADSSNVVYLWDLESGDLAYQSTPAPSVVVTAFAFSGNGRTFAWGGSNNTVTLVDLESGDEVQRLPHPSPVLGIDFSADQRYLLTSALGDTVYVWDLEREEVVRRFFAGEDPAGFVQFADDDTTVMFSTVDEGVIVRQPLDIAGLVETMCANLQRELTAEERHIYGLDDTPTCPLPRSR
jgi:WD40 repeat protein